MTDEESEPSSDNEKRIRIAEACGFTEISLSGPYRILTGMKDRQWKRVPDYPNDLNAMHEAEATLEPFHWCTYAVEIRRIIMRDCDKPECYSPDCDLFQHIADFWFYHATAAQRAEAFLSTLRIP